MKEVPEKMLPGQTPYTPEQREELDELLSGAADAAEEFDEDELEEFAAAQRRKEKEHAHQE